ncbi:MAG TPA: MotA/TolQ/ExbB proton channel family protein [Myxococcales bacterium LLY-WYZ-16_1]|nr:MotA/TolQ/ExbB proton channel family protein [Myxococcales bacterium LLY-WYZ-16_1]
METALAAFLKYLDLGGYVMPPLIFCAVTLWFALGFRCSVLLGANRRSPRGWVSHFSDNPNAKALGVVPRAAKVAVRLRDRRPVHLDRELHHGLGMIKRELNQFRVLAKTVVSLSPLLGLLGTVSGMIETFDSLGDMTLFSQSGGIAGGISQALLTTQFGLAIAIPGLVVGRILDRRQNILEGQIEEVRGLVNANGKADQT